MSTAMLQAPIAAHAVIGDGRATALVDRGGTIDWLVMPEDERIAIFSTLVDADAGGSFTLAPVADADVVSERRYVGASAVLQTTFTTESGSVTVTDSCNLHGGALLPWVEVARRVTGNAGRVILAWELSTGIHLGRPRCTFAEHHGILQTERGGLRVGVSAFDAGDPRPGTDHVGAAFEVAGGDASLVTLVAVVDEPLVAPDRAEIERRVDRTVQSWQEWADDITYDGPWQREVRRSAQTLELAIHPSGSILAAPTTSLPEQIGGTTNYDYRYCWMRDASFAIDAFLAVGLVTEAHRAITALLRAAQRTRPRLTPFSRMDGTVPHDASELDASGYRGSRPVRLGNGATDQVQLGNWGDLFESIWMYVRRGNDLDTVSGELLVELADRVAEIWTEKDSGIWELPTNEHYTISKMGAWVALDRALRLEEAGQLTGDVAQWRSQRDAIRAFVAQRCWSSAKSSYTFHADTDDLDAACLLAARTGFVAPQSAEAQGTIDAVQRELAEGPFIWRYSGRREVEGAFVACSFWMVEALAESGRVDEASKTFEGALGAMNDLGLLAEEYDPDTGEQLGNFPQSLSHLALIDAATMIQQVSEVGSS
ncbi:MAG TPA: glycoside hydrolase family 15 protein [Acidimicrobiales bacterium]|nr:glycoside hydrolase family 15 protein [Acidimicrobiales bacterium]